MGDIKAIQETALDRLEEEEFDKLEYMIDTAANRAKTDIEEIFESDKMKGSKKKDMINDIVNKENESEKDIHEAAKQGSWDILIALDQEAKKVADEVVDELLTGDIDVSAEKDKNLPLLRRV